MEQRQLGEGGFGTVYEVYLDGAQDDTTYALKQIRVADDDDD